ncbi:MAG TPA: hypothetical protein VM840_11990 [Actinomycetota bacterium]|nr:hypothetical protein [Actinomycetota bacterium]
MRRWGYKKRSMAAALGMVLAFGALASPAAARLQATGSTIEQLTSERGVGATHGRALYIAVEGLADVTMGDGAGYVAYGREKRDVLVPVIPSDMLVPCTSGTVGIDGTDHCLDRAKLGSRGIDASPDSKVLEESLFQQKITTRELQSSNSGFPVPIQEGTSVGTGMLKPAADFLGNRLAGFTTGGSTPAANPQGLARSTGIVIPNLAKAEASCDGRTGTQNISDQKTALPLPAPLAPVLTGGIGLASCDLVREAGGSTAYPALRQTFGEVAVDVTATQTLVKSVPAVNQVLDTVEGLAPAPVRDIVSTLQAQLDAAPLVAVRVAPGEELISTSDTGVSAKSVSGDVVIDVLGGVAEIRVSQARSEASVLGGTASATGDCAFVDVKVLNLLTVEPSDYITQRVACPSQNLTLLSGLPAPIGDALAITIQTGQVATTQGAHSAQATSSVLSISLFNSPLPPVRVQLASSGAFAQVTPGKVSNNPGFPAVALPKTGPFAAATAGLGLTILGLAGYVRRRLVG